MRVKKIKKNVDNEEILRGHAYVCHIAIVFFSKTIFFHVVFVSYLG